MSKIPYQSLIGPLPYLLVSTRTDIFYADGLLSEYNANYGNQHWVATKCVLRNLEGTKTYELMFQKTDLEV